MNINKLQVNGLSSPPEYFLRRCPDPGPCAGRWNAQRGKGQRRVHRESDLVQLGLWGKWKSHFVILATQLVNQSCVCRTLFLCSRLNQLRAAQLKRFFFQVSRLWVCLL